MTATANIKANPEYNFEVAMFSIRTLTNLHVGSGGENYGIIDNLIQRDAATGFPCIFSSSLKGALREFCRHYLKNSDRIMIDHIFGLDKKDSDESDNQSKEKKIQAGKYRFLQADLISLPMRATDRPYYTTTGKWQLQNLILTLSSLNKKLQCNADIKQAIDNLDSNPGIHINGDKIEGIELEDIQIEAWEGENIDISNLNIDTDLLLLNDENFVELASDYNLPVIARNTLDNGQSSNLWYEQVVPRETTLSFIVLYPKNDKYFKSFKETIIQYPVQIGANASIGYGFCELKCINLEDINNQNA